MSGILYIVATPIGNLSDMTFRALETLKSVDLIACEDTRQTLKLLNHFEIKKRLISYHQHSRVTKVETILGFVEEGQNVAVVTDAGTPGISDPGGILVSEARKKDIEVVTIPGPSALTAALSVSGLDTKEFIFIGFLPQKKGRQTALKRMSKEERMVVIYESPYRIKKLLNELLEFAGDREIFVARELTKKFEETYRGKISEVLPKISEKGEFVVILDKEKNER
jgi:16S rRNA (cytidine1402-2'-O)-methyltransferase